MFLNDLNASAIDAQPNLLKNFDTLGRRFWHQLKAFPVDYINYGAPDGSFLGLERGSDGDVLLYEDSTRLGRGQLTVFSLSAGGERLEPTEIIPGMSATHEEAWYVDTVTAGRSSWSSIYAWEDQPDIHSVSYNTPLFDGDGQLLGVIGVDMVINQLSTWLHQVWGSRDGLALLIEADGRLIASSTPAFPSAASANWSTLWRRCCIGSNRRQGAASTPAPQGRSLPAAVDAMGQRPRSRLDFADRQQCQRGGDASRTHTRR